jgi:hypothetical protein
MISKYTLLVTFFANGLIACTTKGCGIFHFMFDEVLSALAQINSSQSG